MADLEADSIKGPKEISNPQSPGYSVVLGIVGNRDMYIPLSYGELLIGEIEEFLFAGVEVGEYDAGMFCGYAGGCGLYDG